MIKKVYTLFLASVCFISCSTAQIVVNANGNGNALAQYLAGNGVTISNVVINCPTGASGIFSNGQNSSLGMAGGIVLTSGSVDSIPGPNDLSYAGATLGAPGDADLDNLTSSTTYDACSLEFDMQVLSDSIEFNYIFGSDEYPEFVCSNFNDVFGFFISGPGIVGAQNIALIPGTATAVSINSVNPGVAGASSGGGTCTSLAYSAYYTDNGDGATAPQNANPFYIQYDGFTTVLTAKKKGLQPCQTYHLKLAIADAFDGAYDSGVFLQANSLTSNYIAIDSVDTDVPNVTDAIEGCVNGRIRLHLQDPFSQNATVHFQIGGTAINGVDYTHIADSITIPAGDTIVTIFINPITDALVEGTETVKIYLLLACNNQPYDSAVLNILDSISVSVAPNASICAGDQVQLQATGATTYTWTPALGLSATNIANPVATPAITTVYKCTTTIGICSSYDSLTITVIPPPFTVNAGPDLASCVSPSVQLNAVVTGTPYNGNPFVYDWTPNAGLSDTAILNPTASPVTPTSYIIQVTSGTCVRRDTVNVAIGSIQITDTSTNETCFGAQDGTASITSAIGANPITYIWNTTAVTASITNLAGGVYTVTITDNSGCSTSASLNVASAPVFIVNAGNDVIDCVNPSVQINAAVIGNPVNGNPFVYSWTPTAGLTSTNTLTTTASPATPTDYVILVSSGVCTARDTIHIAIGNLQITSSSTDETCYGYSDGTATTNITVGNAPYHYVWTTPDTTSSLTGLQGGNYDVTVTDGFGCTASASMVVNGILTPFTVNAGTDTIECLNPNVQLNAVVTGTPVNGNPFVYQWTPAAGLSSTNTLTTTASPATPTDYEILVSSGVCTARDTVHVAISTIAINTSSTNETCFGLNDGTGNVNVTAGVAPYNYFWSNSNPTAAVTGLSGGTYYVTVLENFGCRAVDSVTIIAANQIVFTAPVITHVLCFGGNNGSIAVTANGGAGSITYLWSDGQTTPTATILVAGQYNLTVTDASSCTVIQTYDVTEPQLLATTTTTTNAICFGSPTGSATTNPTGGTQPYTYIWTNFAVTNSTFGLTMGVYSCTITDANSCSATTAGVVNEPADITYTTSADAVKCQGDANGVIHVDAQGGTSPYSYSATQDGSNFVFAQNGSIPGLAIGNYIVIIADNYGCTKTDTVTVPNATPDVFIANTDSTSCYGTDYNDGAAHILSLSLQNGPYQYSIDGGVSQYSGDFYALAAGDHTIHAVSFNGCESDTTVTVLEPLPIIAEINPDTVVLPLGESKPILVTYQNATNPGFSWTPAEGLSCIDCANPTVNTFYRGDYVVTVSMVNGTATCFATATVHVTIEPHKPVFVPNSFSPNGDGNNDLFLVYGEDIKLVDLRIFNRWGELVYKTNNQLAGWDGRYKGELQLPQVFTYTAKITYLNDKTASQNGTVTLIR